MGGEGTFPGVRELSPPHDGSLFYHLTTLATFDFTDLVLMLKCDICALDSLNSKAHIPLETGFALGTKHK